MRHDEALRICTWNVNSLKVRFDQLKQLLETERWDIVCLQETKMTDDRFPYEAFRAIGYAAFTQDSQAITVLQFWLASNVSNSLN